MSNDWVIHRLNTGWLYSPDAVSLSGEGRHPAAPGGAIRLRSWQPAIPQPDGRTLPGAMVPAPAWLLRGGGLKILVDTGTGTAEEIQSVQRSYGLNLTVETPAECNILARLAVLDVQPRDIDLVLHTHLHFDHIGGDHLFPAARFLVQREEIPWALCPPAFAGYYFPSFRPKLLSVLDRISFIDKDCTPAPGLRLVHTGGHSQGHCVVFVETRIGTVAIAGDAVYNYRNLELNWPQGPYTDLTAVLRSIELLKTADVVLVNHDSDFDRLFPDDTIGDRELSTATLTYMRRLRTCGAFTIETTHNPE